MLLPAIPLDAVMPASEALARLARHGLWDDPKHHTATAWIEEHRARLAKANRTLSFEEAERRLRRDPTRMGVAIRRQWYGQILWYARPAEVVLRQCLAAAPTDLVVVALGLREEDSRPTVPLDSAYGMVSEGVVLHQKEPVAVNLLSPQTSPGRPQPKTRSISSKQMRSRGAGGEGVPQSAEVSAWPLIEAPTYVEAQAAFTVIVGFATDQQTGLVGDGRVRFAAPPGAAAVELSVELIADGVDAPQGWTRPLVVAVADPTAARATFTLVGRPPAGHEPVHLTMIEARYVLRGEVCGTASRPLEVRAPGYTPPAGLASLGTPWLAQPAAISAVAVEPATQPADLTIEIAKPDGNMAIGRYVCRLRSPHPISDPGPHDIDFGQDSKTFARSIVEEIRVYAADAAVDNLLRAWGGAVAEKLPDAARDALYQVAQITKPEPPTVLIVSAEPYVPWELALVDPPLDPKRPPFLGAQTLLGRWLRDAPEMPAARTEFNAGLAAVPTPIRIRKPPAHPPSTIPVRHMAVMVGVYKFGSGQRPLPEAEKEGTELTAEYNAVALAASTQSLKQLLDARLQHGFQEIGGASVVHFAGHGDFNPSNPDASVMLLNDGKPMPSSMFRSANYGGDVQPLIFLNACMIGIGGELLGSMGGFPGNCLKGGFGGVLGALWEVNDAVAREVALEFWRRVLPKGAAAPEPVAAVLRDLRARYTADAPVPTYLAYVYYGHPRLILQHEN